MVSSALAVPLKLLSFIHFLAASVCYLSSIMRIMLVLVLLAALLARVTRGQTPPPCPIPISRGGPCMAQRLSQPSLTCASGNRLFELHLCAACRVAHKFVFAQAT